MIKHEEIVINNINFIRSYSDLGFKIKQVETNAIYDDAKDLDYIKYNYVETDILIEKGEEENGNS